MNRELLLFAVAVVVAFVLASQCAKRRWVLPAFLLRRATWTALTLTAVFSLSFFLMRSVPGGPFDGERELPPEVRQALFERYQLNAPLERQFLDNLSAMIRGDLGPSMSLRDYRVAQVIAQGLPATFVLGVLALLWALGLGLPAGIIAASRRGERLDRGVMALATLGMALPNFVLAAFLVGIFSFGLGLLPPAGFGSPWDLILPSLALGAPFAAQIARLTRSGFLEVLSSDWVRSARAKGLSEARVLWKHALRGAIMPVIAFLGPAMAGILTGSLVIEEIFAIPGIGSHFVQGALSRDYPLAMGMVLLYTLVLSVLNACADLIQSTLDPRIELQ